jgi:hypothetical protein
MKTEMKNNNEVYNINHEQGQEAEIIDLSKIRENKKRERADRRANMERDKMKRRLAFAS